MLKQLVLKPREARRIRRGHLWVFSNEVREMPTDCEPGELVRVLTHNGDFLGNAIFHPHSLITARLIGKEVEALDAAFFLERIESATRFREAIFAEESCYRLVHGESDRLPGLIIDRFGDYFVIQTLSAGMDARLSTICDVLEQRFQPQAIIERNDSGLRSYEELEQRKGVLRGDLQPNVEFVENGLRYSVNLLEGQKTGFFLDQKLNRLALRRYVQGASVLDCFSNQGGFALNAARAGAAQVIGVDVSGGAVAHAEANARLNSLQNVTFVESDVFKYLQKQRSDRVTTDVVVVDPPSFAPRKKDVGAAKRAYRKLNELAIGVLNPGGILVTASCSYHLNEETFYRLISEAAQRASRDLQLLEQRQQSPDHPILPAMPETRYLKLGIFRVL